MKIIKLNEAILNKLIKDAINEMAWQTYANAADKREQQGNENSGLFSKRGGPISDFEKKVGKDAHNKAKKLRSASIAQWKKDHKGDKTDYNADVEKLRNGEYEYEKGKGWKEVDAQEESRKHFHRILEQILNEQRTVEDI